MDMAGKMQKLIQEMEAIKKQAKTAIADSRETNESAKSLIKIIKETYKEVS